MVLWPLRLPNLGESKVHTENNTRAVRCGATKSLCVSLCVSVAGNVVICA